MKYFLALFALLALSQGTPLNGSDESSTEVKAASCTPGCPRILDPVCADDGANGYKYFHNECLMQYASCRAGAAWTLTELSFCLQRSEAKESSDCMRPCHLIYDPVCATNGQVNEIFGNDCFFAVHNCFANKQWNVARDSDCGL